MKTKIAVLMGGRSLEREVSLASGLHVSEALEALGYYVLGLDVTSDLVATLRSERPAAAYIALHGKFGEDGTIQELLEFLGVPYTGPGVVASAMAWDKSVAKHLFAEKGIPTPEWLTLTADAFKEMGAATALDLVPDVAGGFPLAVKPSRQGSALGMRKVLRAEDLADALLNALSFDTAALVERWVDGVELAVTVLGEGDSIEVLPPVEIGARGGIYDFDARMASDGADFFAPARVSGEITQLAMDVAGQVHNALGCRDVSRVDMMIDAEGRAQVLECNTSPGMTQTSLLPMAARAAGMTFQDVVSRVVRAALARSESGT